MRTCFGPVFPVLPSYRDTGELDFERTASYVRYLADNGAGAIMTTAGTTQFNLLSEAEIMAVNATVGDHFPGRLILGVPLAAEMFLMPFLAATLERHKRAGILINYPERFYSQGEMAGFFGRIGQVCPAPIYVHGLQLRTAHGGTQDYTGEVVTAILECCGNFVGMKEECSSYEAGFRLCSALSNRPEFEMIVAGGSMRRFLLLRAAGAQSFLAGVGSLFPSVDIAFFRHITAGAIREASLLISEIETPLFAVFMDIGWHKALRYAAKSIGLIGAGERRPMAGPEPADCSRIDRVLRVLEDNMQGLHSAGVI